MLVHITLLKLQFSYKILKADISDNNMCYLNYKTILKYIEKLMKYLTVKKLIVLINKVSFYKIISLNDDIFYTLKSGLLMSEAINMRWLFLRLQKVILCI